MSVAGWLEARWYGDRKPGFMLLALASIYGAGVHLRRFAYRRDWLRVHRIGVPVIVIGNLSVGGSGKTPLVIAVVEHLRKQGLKPGVVSRGYGRSSRRQCVVDLHTSTQDGGDEPVLIARRCDVPVVVDVDRVAAARKAIELGCDIVVADDGLQHYRLHRDVEIEVIDGVRRYGNQRMLPAGPLREPTSRADACTLHVVNGDCGDARQSSMHLRGDTMFGRDARAQPLDALRSRRVHAVAGIGNPRRFFDHLRAHGLELIEHAFADHHAYRAQELDFKDGLPIVMTEKDWVKCSGFVLDDGWMLPVSAELDDEFFRKLDQVLAASAGDVR